MYHSRDISDLRADGSLYDLSEEIKLDKNKKHNIEIVVDRLVIREDIARLSRVLEDLGVFAFFSPDHRGHDLDSGGLGQG